MINNLSAEPMDFLPNRVSDKWYDFLIICYMIDSRNMKCYDMIIFMINHKLWYYHILIRRQETFGLMKPIGITWTRIIIVIPQLKIWCASSRNSTSRRQRRTDIWQRSEVIHKNGGRKEKRNG
jgi:hypothetical protein